MKKPENCESIEDIRDGIDTIDQQIIELLGLRFKFVKEIVKFKSNADEVKAKKRYDEVFTLRRKWAKDNGLSAETIDQVYKILVHYFIDEQMKLLREKQKENKKDN